MNQLFTFCLFSFLLAHSGLATAQSVASPAFLLKNPEERALILHRKGVEAWKKGDLKKAKRYFKISGRAATERSRELEMFEFYVECGDTRTALTHLERTKCGDACDGIDRVREMAAFGLLFGNLDKRRGAVSYYAAALRDYKTYSLHDSVLYSTLLNNYAVLTLFDQGKNGQKEEAHFKYIAQKDIKVADFCLNKAIKVNPTNCMAQNNLLVVKDLKKMPPGKNGYIPDSMFLNAVYRKVPDDCLPKDTINKFESLETTFKEASDLLLIMDFSGSMYEGNRFALMMETVTHLIDTLPAVIRIGLLSVDGSCDQAPMIKVAPGTMNRDELRAVLLGKSAGGPTPLNARLEMAPAMFPKGGKNRMAMLLTDGVDVCDGPTRTCALAEDLKEQHIQVYVLTQLLEGDDSYLSYGVYSCLAANTHGELLCLESKSGTTKKSVEARSALYNLPLDMKQLGAGKMTPFKPQSYIPEPAGLSAATSK